MFPSRRITTSSGDKIRDQFSLTFDGTDDFVACGSASELDVGTSEFSVSAWFKITADAHGTVVSKGDNFSGAPYNTHGWAIGFLATSDRIYFDVYAGTDGGSPEDVRLATFASITLNVWNHCVCTRTTSGADSVYSLYLNGVLAVANTAEDGGDYDALAADGTISDAGNNLEIGRSSRGGSIPFTGPISDVAFYKTGLTASQVKTLYNGREPYNHKEGIASDDLKGWWRLGDGTENGDGTTIYDMSGEGNDGTMTNMAADDFVGDAP